MLRLGLKFFLHVALELLEFLFLNCFLFLLFAGFDLVVFFQFVVGQRIIGVPLVFDYGREVILDSIYSSHSDDQLGLLQGAFVNQDAL